MAYAPYEFIFTDQNPNREFVVQPYTYNGPSSPDGGIDPSAANANTTLFLYGKGTPNYGDRIQENMIFMMEHFFSPTEPSFPIPGQLWCQSSSNEIIQPFQMFMFNPRKFKITAASGNQIYVISDDGSLPVSQVLTRFQALGLSKQFTVYDSNYNQLIFIQSASPVISGSTVLLSVTPAITTTIVGQFVGGWEEIYQGNATVVLRRALNANNNNIINLATPVNPQDAATKAYVDLSAHGGTLTLGGEPTHPGTGLSDVVFQIPNFPQTGAFLYYNGTTWTDTFISSLYLALTGGTLSGPLNMGGNPINNVALPSTAYDVANMAYVLGQPLSSSTVIITTPVTGNILYYMSSGVWTNADPATAGVVPLSGGVTITGALAVTGGITGLPPPVNPTDAATKAYVDASVGSGSGTITGGSFNDATGTLTLTPSGLPNINITGWLPTPNNQVSDLSVVFTPQNPNSQPTNTPNTFFANTLGDATYNGPNTVEDPINVKLHAALNQIDVALGNFTIPKQRFIFTASGTRQQFDINNGLTLGASHSLGGKFVKGSNNLEVYINGVKQVASTEAVAKITNFTVGASYPSVTFQGASVTIPGNVSRVFHPGVQFTTSGSNTGSYTTVSSSYNGTNTIVIVESNGYSSTPGPYPLTTGTGSITYTVNELTGDMETGYVYTGLTSTPKNITVAVNGLASVTLSIDPALNNCSSLALLCDQINQQALKYYINPIVGISGLNFIVTGNVAAQFTTGTSFTIRYATNNGPGDTGTTYTVTSPGAVYSAGQTFIPVASIPNSSPADGIIFQDRWGFNCEIQNGFFTFHSNIPGSSSSIVVTDPGGSTGLISNITGITWPMIFTSPLVTQGNAFTPTDYAYKEVGIYGYVSSLFYFNIAPTNTDTLEVLIDREMIYNSTNPLAAATIA